MVKDFDIPKLKGSGNYHTWQFAMKSLLEFNGFGKCINTTIVPAVGDGDPSVTCAETSEDKKSKAKAMIVLAVEQSIYVHINKCTDALQMWQTLQKLYEDTGLKRKIGLLRDLIQCRLEDCDDIQDFIDKIKSTANKLTGIGFDISDEWLGAILLAGLTDEYGPMIMTIESNNQEISADAIISKLMDMKVSSKSGEAFLGKGGKNNGKRNTKKKKKATNSNPNANEKRRCYICESDQHLAFNCPKRTNGRSNEEKKKADTASAFMVGMLSVCKRDEWYIDSGASIHMSPFSDILIDKKKACVGDITTANNAKMQVECMGKSLMRMNDEVISVNEVLHVPKLGANLLSVHKMVCRGNTIVFDLDGCKIFNKEKKLLKLIKPENGIYKLCAPNETICMLANKNESNTMLWHRRFGHLNYGTLCQLNNAVAGINVNGNDTQIKQCKVCDLGKQHRKPFPVSSTRTKKILEVVHTDLCGPMETKSLAGARYMLTFTDDFSRKTFLYFLKEKSQVFKSFMEFKMAVENETECKIKCIRSDNGMEYMAAKFNDFCKENGILHQLTCTYTPEQNGVAERANRTIVEKAKCMLFDGGLGKEFWAEACNTAAYVMNRTPRVRLQNKTPIEMWSGEKPDVSSLRIFGSKVMVHTPKEKRKKWSPKASEMIFIGYDNQKKGYRCYDSESKKVTVSRDVNFYESISSTVLMDGGRNCDENEETVVYENVNENENDGAESDDGLTENIAEMSSEVIENDISPQVEHQQNESIADPNGKVVPQQDDSGTVDVSTADDGNKDAPNDENGKNFSTKTYPPVTARKSDKDRRKVRPFQMAHFALFAGEPQNVREALESDENRKWRAAMEEEMSSHRENMTWTLAKLPLGRKAIKAKWVFKVKSDGDDKPERFKARLVAKGYAQQAGIDFDETYSPVVRHSTIRFLIALAVEHNMRVYQMDAVTAFLQGELAEEIYMNQPEEFHDGTDRVCRLNKAVYGLKQAGRVWNKKLDGFLTSLGFKCSRCDPCVYVKEGMIIAVYVDDLLIFYRNTAELDATRSKLHEKFRMKDIGHAKRCLGIDINQGNGYIELDQSKYILFLLEKFGMAQCKPCKTPSELNQQLTKAVDECEDLVGVVPYQELVGSLLYLANGTRPDIAYSTSDVSRFNANHTEMHWVAAKRILRYLRGTVNLKLKYERNASPLQVYCDADWGSSIDDRKSRTGYVVIMSGGAVSWCSKKQSVVALSSTEAEYIALSSAAREILWVAQLREEIGYKYRDYVPTVFCDNQSAIRLAQCEGYRPRTKHIDIRLHHVRDLIGASQIQLKHVGTEKQVADSLTKPVTGEKTTQCASGMGLKNTH